MQLSKVGGGSGNGTPRSILQTSHPDSCVQGNPSHNGSRTISSDSSSSSDGSIGSSTSSRASLSSSSMALTKNTVYNSYHSTHIKTNKNLGPVSHKKSKQVGTQKAQELESPRLMNHTPRKRGSLDGAGRQLPHVPGCYMEVMSNNSSSSSSQNKVAGTGEWNGWLPVTTLGKSGGWRPHLGHSSSCLRHTGGMTPLPGNPTSQQTSHLLMSPSWTSLGWPQIPSPTHPFNPKNTITHASHSNVSKAMWLPPQSPSTHSRTLPYAGVQIHQSSQAQQSPEDPQVSHTITPSVQAKGTTSFLEAITTTTTTANSSSSSTTSTSSNKTDSPLSKQMPSVSPYLAPYPGSGIEQITYGCMNQQPLLMMPYYQYGGTVTPYYQWAAPVVMQWQLTPTPTTHHSTPTLTTVAPKMSETCQPHSTLSFTPWSPENKRNHSPQSIPVKSSEGILDSSGNSLYLGPSQGNTILDKKSPHNAYKVHTPTSCASLNTYCEKLSTQKNTDDYEVANSESKYKLLPSPHKAASSPQKFPQPVLTSPPEVAHARLGVGTRTEGNISVLPPLCGDRCTSMPITPPPTPLLETDNLSAAVAKLNGS